MPSSVPYKIKFCELHVLLTHNKTINLKEGREGGKEETIRYDTQKMLLRSGEIESIQGTAISKPTGLQ